MRNKATLVSRRLLAIVLVLSTALGLLYLLRSGEATQEAADESAPAADILHLGEIEATVTRQNAVEQELIEIEQSGGYTLEDPYVQLDPYGESPLTAIAIFDTETPAQITVHVAGDTDNADVDFSFDAYETRHTVPILGLYPGRENAVTLTATAQDGSVRETVLTIATEALPAFFDGFRLIAETLDENAYAEGLNFPLQSQQYVNYPFAFDANGDIRWYLANYTSDMEYFFVTDSAQGIILGRGYAYGDTVFSVVNMLGKVSGYTYAAYGSHHDLYQTEHGTWIITGSEPYSTATKEDILYELSAADGSILHVLDFKNILEKTRVYGAEDHSGNYDWLHLNTSVEYQNDVIVSSNYQSLVMRLGWDGEIRWMMTDPTGYLELYAQYMLTPIGEDFQWSYNQHAIEVLPDQDGNPDTLDLLLFDNGTSRSIVDDAVDSDYSRLVQYRIDEENMTVEQIWSYGSDRPELYSAWCGDANLLPNGNVLGTFSVSSASSISSEHGVYLEVAQNGDLVWECLAQSVLDINIYASYRCERMNIYTENMLDLHLGEEAQVHVPDAVWNAYGIAAFSTARTETSEATPQATAAPQSTQAPAAETQDAAVWTVSAESAELLPTLHTQTEVLQYEGDYKTVTYDTQPADGMQFALLRLTVTKAQGVKSTFDWAGLALVLADGSAYARAEDTWLTDHGYARISGAKLSLGSASGYACFEIPLDADLTGAVLQYTSADGTAVFPLAR